MTTPPAPWQPPEPPGGISVSAGQTWVELTWDPFPDAVLYLVETEGRIPGAPSYGKDANTGGDTSTWLFPNPDSGSAFTTRIESLQPDTSYTFEVRACVEHPGQDRVVCGVPATVSVTTSKP